MIELQEITKRFGEGQSAVTAIDHLNLRVDDGETVALIGPSGCGKTTTMKLVNRLIDPTSGSVRVEGTDVRNWDIIRLRRRMGYVIQSGGLFPHMTVGRNVGLLCELEGWPRARVLSRVGDLLELVNLRPEAFARRYPRELSGGQRQRVGVARSLALDPPYVLLDEPFGALDPITRAQIHDEFLQLKARVRKTMVIVTHDMDEAFKLADRIALMNAGRIEQLGVPDDFRSHPATPFVRAFLEDHLARYDAAPRTEKPT